MIDQYQDYNVEASKKIQEMRDFIKEETERVAAQLLVNKHSLITF